MKRVRWAVAMILVLAMMMLGGCAGRDGTNDGTVDDGVVDDGMTNDGYNDTTNNNGNGGVLSDIADGMENGIDNIRDGMDTIEDDTRTDLGTGGSDSQMSN